MKENRMSRSEQGRESQFKKATQQTLQSSKSGEKPPTSAPQPRQLGMTSRARSQKIPTCISLKQVCMITLELELSRALSLNLYPSPLPLLLSHSRVLDKKSRLRRPSVFHATIRSK